MRLFFAILWTASMLGAALSAPALDWRVAHPFRFFTNPADFDMQREAMADLMRANEGAAPADLIPELERLVNDPRWLDEWYRATPELYTDADGRARPDRGWAHHIERRRAACWNASEQWHSSCGSDRFEEPRRTDYVLPQAHTVVLTVNEPPAGDCRWSADVAIFIDGRSLRTEAVRPCSADVNARIPFDPNATAGSAVRVSLPDASQLQTDVLVKDRLIVGIGDSFSSGEGNPDTPVDTTRVTKRYRNNYNFPYDSAAKALKATPADSLAVRPRGGEPAFWSDRQCHRSAYSYHMRTALQVALADPKRSAVTFLGFACSGAEILEGLLGEYSGVEVVADSNYSANGLRRRFRPQVDRIMTELCRDNLTAAPKQRRLRFNPALETDNGGISNLWLLDCPPDRLLRPIDMLIVSIGGNDVGFSSLVIDVLTKNRPDYANITTRLNAAQNLNGVISGIARLIKAHGIDVAQDKARRLPERFAALRRALETLPIRKDALGRPNILLTAFPQIEFNEQGQLCGTNDPRERLEGMNVGGVLAIDVPTLRQVSTFANTTLLTALRDAAAAGGWRFVSSHRQAFAKRGICAQRPGATSPAENLMLPYYSVGRWIDFNPGTQLRAYAPRQRLFRTLNDACLFVQFKRKGTPTDPSRWGPLDLIESCMGGPFHPTAEGHAYIAEAVYEEAKRMLGLPDPKIEDLLAK